ncbi:MAG: hypothetical protein LBD67_00225 [Candidatus Accumulibacter sp.]|nr:hypothetical protein [Accumulibacter sp.]
MKCPENPFVLSLSRPVVSVSNLVSGLLHRTEAAGASTTPISVHGDFVGTHRQRVFPFVLSLSKYERTLQVTNTLSNPDSFFESFFNPYPSTSSGRTD